MTKDPVCFRSSSLHPRSRVYLLFIKYHKLRYVFVFRGDSSPRLSLVHLLKAGEKLCPQHSCSCNTGLWWKPASWFSSVSEYAVLQSCLLLKHNDSFPGLELMRLKTQKNIKCFQRVFKKQNNNDDDDDHNHDDADDDGDGNVIIITIRAFWGCYCTPCSSFCWRESYFMGSNEESQPIQLLESNILRKEEPLLLFLWRVPLSCSKQLCWYLDIGYQLRLHFQHNLYLYPAGFISPQMVHNACVAVSQPNSACCLSGV